MGLSVFETCGASPALKVRPHAAARVRYRFRKFAGEAIYNRGAHEIVVCQRRLALLVLAAAAILLVLPSLPARAASTFDSVIASTDGPEAEFVRDRYVAPSLQGTNETPLSPRPSLGTFLLLGLAAGLTLSLAAVAFVRRRALRAAAHSGSGLRRRMPTTLEAGGSYLVAGADPSRAYGIFAAYVDAGAKGLVLSRLYPDEVRARHPVGPSSILWLSRGYGRSAVNPTNLGRMVTEIERHVAGREASIILLDHVDYLLRQNGAPAVAKFLEGLTGAVSTHHSRLLVPIDPATIAPADSALLTRDLRNV